MIKDKNGIDWNTFDDKYKYGRFIYKVETTEIKVIPQSNAPVTFTRNRFKVVPAFDLSLRENKIKFFNNAFGTEYYYDEI